jgi:hypothetical protein
MMAPPAIFIQKTGINCKSAKPTVTIIADVIVKATDPEANAVSGFILVARVSSRRASLSVNSATNIAKVIVAKAPRRAAFESIKSENSYPMWETKSGSLTVGVSINLMPYQVVHTSPPSLLTRFHRISKNARVR